MGHQSARQSAARVNFVLLFVALCCLPNLASGGGGGNEGERGKSFLAEYDELFTSKGWSRPPSETLHRLRTLSEAYKHRKNLELETTLKLQDVDDLLAYSDQIECGSASAKRLNHDLASYSEKQYWTIVAYLQSCQRKMFAKCRPQLEQLFREAMDRLGRKLESSGGRGPYRRMGLFKSHLAQAQTHCAAFRRPEELPDKVKDAIGSYMKGQAGERVHKERYGLFRKLFQPAVVDMCKAMIVELEFFSLISPEFFVAETAAKLWAHPMLHWFEAANVCRTIYSLPEEAAKSVYEHMNGAKSSPNNKAPSKTLGQHFLETPFNKAPSKTLREHFSESSPDHNTAPRKTLRDHLDESSV